MLDGLRGLALAAVLLYHVAPDTFPGGFLGVEVFFVLSAYLLTSLLLDERRRTGAISRWAFGVRRFRRLAPGLLAFLVGLVLVVPIVAGEDAHRLQGDVLSSAAGLTNWHLIQDGSSYFSQIGRPSFVRHVWSLAVEIQFYVLCPFLVVWLTRRKVTTRVWVLGAGVAASSLALGLLYASPDPSRGYFGTDARIGAMVSGVLLAVVLDRWPAAGRRRSDRIALLGLAGLAVAVLTVDQRARLLYPLGFLATQAAAAAAIVAGHSAGRVRTLLERRQLRWLGVRSYGIYLWHWPLVVILRPGIDVSWARWQAAVVSITGACLLGALSYRWIERPLMKRRSRADQERMPEPVVRPRRWPARVAVLGAAACIAALTVRLPTTDPIAASLRAGEKLLAEQAQPVSASAAAPADGEVSPGGFLLVGTPPPVDPPPTAAPAPAAAAVPPPTPAPPPLTVTALGDSVMLGAAPALHARLGPPGYIDAQQNRSFGASVALTRQLREQGRLGQVVVIHLGNNGPVHDNEVDALMAQLVDVPRVLFVTVRVNRQWQGQSNAALAAGDARYPKITLVDWLTYSEGHRDWFQSDGTHLKGPGSAAYADLVAANLVAPPPRNTGVR
jgi:peptidoglycan/LPS O-acetylase OafA/YrhL